MTSHSGEAGHCERCGCANDNHIFGVCEGRDKKDRKDRKDKKDKKGAVRWEKCKVVWIRCTSGGHGHIGDGTKYIDCNRCWKHPGAPPSSGEFWGTQPDDDFVVQTADEIGIPWPDRGEGPSESQKEEKTWEFSHSRGGSGSSEDPLQWSKERFEAETGDLVKDLERSTLVDSSTASSWSAWAWGNEQWMRYRTAFDGEYEYDYQAGSPEWSAWTWEPERGQNYCTAEDPDGELYYFYDDSQNEVGGSQAVSKNKTKPSKKGKGKGKRT